MGKDERINLIIDSHQLSGARQMLLKLSENYRILPKERNDRYDAVYTKAEIYLALSSIDNTRHFLYGDKRIYYRNHKRNGSGKLISVEAYFDD